VGERSSEDTSQRQAVWRQEGNAIKVQMESLTLDVSTINKAKRIKEMFLYMFVYLEVKPFRHKLIFFRQGHLLK
jgi:hypothetical protein